MIGKPSLTPSLCTVNKYRAVPSTDPRTPTHEGGNTPMAGTQTGGMDESRPT